MLSAPTSDLDTDGEQPHPDIDDVYYSTANTGSDCPSVVLGTHQWLLIQQYSRPVLYLLSTNIVFYKCKCLWKSNFKLQWPLKASFKARQEQNDATCVSKWCITNWDIHKCSSDKELLTGEKNNLFPHRNTATTVTAWSLTRKNGRFSVC